MCSICETIWTDNIENGWTLIEKTGGEGVVLETSSMERMGMGMLA